MTERSLAKSKLVYLWGHVDAQLETADVHD
jgi:hypothetical protein